MASDLRADRLILKGDALAPATPNSGQVILYPITDNDKFRSKDDAGNEQVLFAAPTIRDEHSVVSLTQYDVESLTFPFLDGGDGIALLNYLPRPGLVNWARVAAANNTLAEIGVNIAPTGTITEANDADGVWANLASAASAGSTAGFTLVDTYDVMFTGSDVDFHALIKTPATITNLRYWIGWGAHGYTGAQLNANNPQITFYGLRYMATEPEMGWCAVVQINSFLTAAPLGVAVVANTAYELRIQRLLDRQGGADTWVFTVNGIVKAILMTSGAAQNLVPYVWAVSSAAAAANIKISDVYWEVW